PFAVSSANGLYILYVSGANLRLRLVYNVFNNSRFTTWCAQDRERFGQAIDAQSTFCWNALKIPSTISPDGFVDFRCSCIGGERLFDMLLPTANSVPKGLFAPFQENMPCIVRSCQS